MTFSDKPEPGMDHIALLLLFNIGCMAIAGWQLVQRDILNDPFEFIIFAVTFVVVLFFTAKSVRAAFNTEYRIEDGRLILSQGKREKSVELATIESIDLDDSIFKYFRLTKTAFVNRMGDFVRIKAGGSKYLLTPTNPQLFISHIRGMLYRGPDYNGTVGPVSSSTENLDSSA